MEQQKRPFLRANKVARSGPRYPDTGGNIAAIDFGTTFCSLAYTIKGDESITTFKFSDTHQRAPNSILLHRQDGGACEIVEFGYRAASEYLKVVKRRDSCEYIYFERIKMLLEKDESVDRTTLVESFNGDKYFLVEVIAFIIKALKDELIKKLSMTVRALRATDFHWVITVPAIWRARAKRMMREAAYMAGLLSDNYIIAFTPTKQKLPLQEEQNADQLSLALEPEAAAIYAQNDTREKISAQGHGMSLDAPPMQYMVVDIGGGTVDITVHDESDGDGVKVIVPPCGNAWGGATVNKTFSSLLQEKFFGDRNFEKFLSFGDNRKKQMATINKLLYTEFEEQKTSFGEKYSKARDSSEICIELPADIESFYKKAILRNIKALEGVTFDSGVLYFTYPAAERLLFSPTIEGITKCTMEALERVDSSISTLYLVGGFGGCDFVYTKMNEALRQAYPTKEFHVFRPEMSNLAIVNGAVMWRKHPTQVKSRKVDATYGIAMQIPYDPKIHDPQYKSDIDENGIQYVTVFCSFIEKGEFAQSDSVMLKNAFPTLSKDSSINIRIFSTLDNGVQYLKDSCGKATVREIGCLIVHIPNPDDLPKKQRLTEVTIDFSGTEIHAKAKYVVTQTEVRTVCDFLSHID